LNLVLISDTLTDIRGQVQSYYHREVYTICYLLATTWPLFYGSEFVRKNWILCSTWACSCAAMSIFTLLPANKVENANLILLGGLITVVVGLAYILLEKSMLVQTSRSNSGLASNKPDSISRAIMGVQVGLVTLAMVVTRSSVFSLQAKQGLPLGTQVVGWATLIASFVVPFLHALQPQDHYLHRLAITFLAFGPLFVILTISYEGLFYFAIAITLLSWVRLEHRIHQTFSAPQSSPSSPASNGSALKSELTTTPLSYAAENAQTCDRALQKGTASYRSLTLSDARICLFFLFLLQSAFFSTGNIASISSFSLDAVYRLIPVFDPFSQGALLLLKLLAPFALVSANLGILTKRLRLRSGSLFAVVMGIGDYLTLRFFWEVRDEGSWLEIGESISMFVIASLLCIFVAGLEGISEVFVKGVEFEGDRVEVDGGERTLNGDSKTKRAGVVGTT
jgi:phosphatidylinositol glycan class N